MPTVLDWSPTVDPSEFVRNLAEVLAVGSPVVLPGECGYVVLVNPTGPNAGPHLAALAAAGADRPAVLAWGSDTLAGLGLPVSLVGRRLTRRAWPGPLLVRVPGRPHWPTDWPEVVRAALAPDGSPVGFRCPEHPLFEAAAPALDSPLLAVDTFRPTAEEALDAVDDPGALAVSVGERPAAGQPTVVTLTDAGYEITEPGLLPTDEIEKYAARLVLFVCTGNTCRSPLAAALASRLLCDRLGCSPEELPRRGLWLLSAGVATSGGSPASEESVAVAAEFGIDLSRHRSRPVNPELLSAADEVIAMTAAHIHALVHRFGPTGPPPRLLCGDDDLDDPIGAGLDTYRQCAQKILTNLERFLTEWVGP